MLLEFLVCLIRVKFECISRESFMWDVLCLLVVVNVLLVLSISL